MNTAEKLMQKKHAFRLEMKKTLTKEQCDTLWRQATEKLDETMDRYSPIPKDVRMHTGS